MPDRVSCEPSSMRLLSDSAIRSGSYVKECVIVKLLSRLSWWEPWWAGGGCSTMLLRWEAELEPLWCSGAWLPDKGMAIVACTLSDPHRCCWDGWVAVL